MRFSAVDIGSNAIRLLFSEVFRKRNGEVEFRKLSLVRLPVRLGEDAFIEGKIKKAKVEKMRKAMRSFKLLNEIYEVKDFRVCATSAMREASNSDEIIKLIKEDSDIEIEILKGKEEAEMIFESHVADMLSTKGCYLYVDVGGGSTELSIFKKGQRLTSDSFDVGTLRVKNDIVKKATWESMKEWLQNASTEFEPLLIIGTGGNINRLYKMAGLKDYAPFFYKQLKELNRELSDLSNKDKIEKLGLKPDRADVIVPASDIFLKIMKWSGIKEIMVPKKGLADGLVYGLFEKHRSKGSL